MMHDFRTLWRFWSVKLAAFVGLLVGYLVANRPALDTLLDYVPDQWRPLAAVVIGFVAFAVPTAVRGVKQAEPQ
ncbi:hypothetical protein [Novosphingobium sp.]|uniref:DUF7940 domain-containing protein n=1 Tax=Novosphingobium sp. TaxID=1874826 RepID=UPI0038B9BD99